MPDQKVAVITGTSSGIGLLTAIEIRPERLPGCRHDARSRPRQPPGRCCPKANVRKRVDIRQPDVTAFASIPATIDTIVKDHGRIDLLVNNAGFSMSGFAEDMSLDELRRQFDTNFFGVVAMSKAVISVMRRQKSGHIIQVASVAGRVGNPLLSAYGSSKFALEG